MCDVSGPRLLVAWRRLKRSWDWDEDFCLSSQLALVMKQEDKEAKKMKRFWSASELFFSNFAFSSSFFCSCSLLQESLNLLDTKRDEFSTASPWSLFLLARPSFQTWSGFLSPHCFPPPLLHRLFYDIFLPRDLEPLLFYFPSPQSSRYE